MCNKDIVVILSKSWCLKDSLVSWSMEGMIFIIRRFFGEVSLRFTINLMLVVRSCMFSRRGVGA
mgnify:CR=1 FL=1